MRQDGRGSGVKCQRNPHRSVLTYPTLLENCRRVHDKILLCCKSTQHPVTHDRKIGFRWTDNDRQLWRANPHPHTRASLANVTIIGAEVFDLHVFRLDYLTMHDWLGTHGPRVDVLVVAKEPYVDVQAKQCALPSVYAESAYDVPTCKLHTWSGQVGGQIVPITPSHPVFSTSSVNPVPHTLWIGRSVLAMPIILL